MLSRSIGAVLVATAAIVAAGCGGSDDATSTAGGDAASGATTTNAAVYAAEQRLERTYRGTDRGLPQNGPRAVGGKDVWVIACSTAAPGCQVAAESAVEAGKAIGWKMKLVDGKLDPGTFSRAIRSAAAAGADALVPVAIDCASATGAMTEARARGVEIYPIYSLDCDDRYTRGKPVFSAELSFGKHGTYGQWMGSEFAGSIADFVIAETDGHANVLALSDQSTAIVRHIVEGFEHEMRRCQDCTVTRVPVTGLDLVTGKASAKVTAALTRDRDVNVVMAPHDAAAALGAAPAVQQARASGRKLILTGGEGLAPGIELIRKRVQDFAAGAPSAWVGWAAVDGLNRVFASKPQVDEGIGVMSIDKDHNLPTRTLYYDGNPSSAGYRDRYLQMWGVG